ASERTLGPCRNYAHDIPPPPPPPMPVLPPPLPKPLAQPIKLPVPVPSVHPMPRRQWRCTRCGALIDTDPCPECRSWRVAHVGDRLPLGACPLCSKEHGRCQFASGSLYCVSPHCDNPHHGDPSVYRGDRTA